MDEQPSVTFTSVDDKTYDITSDQQAQTLINDYKGAIADDQQHVDEDEAILKNGGSSATAITKAQKDLTGAEMAIAAGNKDIAGVEAAEVKLNTEINNQQAIAQAASNNAAAEAAYSSSGAVAPTTTATAANSSSSTTTTTPTGVEFTSVDDKTYDITSDQQAQTLINDYKGAIADDQQHVDEDEAILKNGGSSATAITKAQKDLTGAEMAIAAGNKDIAGVEAAEVKLNEGTGGSVSAASIASANNEAEDTSNSTAGMGHQGLGVQGSPTATVASDHKSTSIVNTEGGVGHQDLGVQGSPTATVASDHKSTSIVNTEGGVGHQGLGVSGSVASQSSNSNIPLYTVHAGDTMTSIAEKYGVSLTALEDANKNITNPNLIYPGHKIIIPEGATSSTAVSEAASATQSVPSTANKGVFSKIKATLTGKSNIEGGVGHQNLDVNNSGGGTVSDDSKDPATKAVSDQGKGHLNLRV